MSRLARLLVLLLTPLLAAVPVAGPVSSYAAPAGEQVSPPPAKDEPQVQVTFRVQGCEGCRIGLVSGVWPEKDRAVPDVWDGPKGRVSDGEVTFTVPQKRTRGLSATIMAPWEGTTGYVGLIAFGYRGVEAGERIRVQEARTYRRGAACWAGTTRPAVTIPLVARRVSVEGVGGPTTGTLAFAKRAVETMTPRQRAFKGVLGTQDVVICGRR